MVTLGGEGRLRFARAVALSLVLACDGSGSRRPARDPVATDRDALRTALAGALTEVPATAVAVAGVVVAELRATPSLAPVLATANRELRGRLDPRCAVDWVRDTDWLLVVVDGGVEITAAGRWSRAEVERCLAGAQWRADGALVVALGTGAPASSPGPVAAAAGRLDRRATAWAVVGGELLGAVGAGAALPPGSLVVARAWLAGGTTTVDAAMTATSADDAAHAERAIRAAVTRALATPGASALATAWVTRVDADLRLEARLSPAATSAALGELASSLAAVR